MDIEHASLQNADGRTAFEQGTVEAYRAGLDPPMAANEIEASSKRIDRDVSSSIYGFLEVTDSLSKPYRDHVRRVITASESARVTWIAARSGRSGAKAPICFPEKGSVTKGILWRWGYTAGSKARRC